MLVVSDTSPLRALSVIGHLKLIHAIYGKVFLPPGVVSELAVQVPNLPPVAIADHPFLEIQAPSDMRRVAELRQSLGQGEAEAIALAIEIRSSAILIDEHRGRVAAEKLGLTPVGVLAVLSSAKRRGLIESVGPLVDVLKARIAFRVHPDVLQHILRAAGET